MILDHLSTEENMSVLSIPYKEKVNSIECDAHFQTGIDKLPKFHSQNFFSGSSSEERSPANAVNFWAAIPTNKGGNVLLKRVL